MHVKDGINTTAQFNPSPTNTRGGSPRAFGTGEVDYRPILAAGKARSSTTARSRTARRSPTRTSLRNLRAVGPNIVPTILGLPTTFRRPPPAPRLEGRHDQEHR